MNSDKKSKEIEYMYEDIMKDLHDGVVRVTFTKKDGTERKMKCTLNENMMPQFETVKTNQAKDVNREVIKCWDLEKEAWRSFRVDSVKIAFFEAYGDK